MRDRDCGRVYLASSSTLVLGLEAGEVGRVLDAVEDRSDMNDSRREQTWWYYTHSLVKGMTAALTTRY